MGSDAVIRTDIEQKSNMQSRLTDCKKSVSRLNRRGAGSSENRPNSQIVQEHDHVGRDKLTHNIQQGKVSEQVPGKLDTEELRRSGRG